MPLFKKRAEKRAQQQRSQDQHSNGGPSHRTEPSGAGSAPAYGSMRGYVGSHVNLDPATSMAPSDYGTTSRMHGRAATADGAAMTEQQAPVNGVDPGTGEPLDVMMQSKRPIKYGRKISKRTFNIGGLPVQVYGMDELTPASARALARPPPEVCIAIHMHGRGGSADNEEHIIRHLWDRVARSRAQYAQNGRNGHAEQSSSMRELIFVGFDGRNHGHRKTSALGQKGWKQDNPNHGMDLYSMIVGGAHDVSFLVDFLSSYLFPHDERRVTQWVVTGKSLGGHSTWHVLANEPRVTVGVPFISCPDFAKLMERRTKTAFVTNGPPYIPHSLAQLIARVDPASRPIDVPDPGINPFWGKKICMLNGSADKLVPFRCGEDFVQRLVVGPRIGPHGHQAGFRVSLREGLGHEVTDDMIEEGGQWIFTHAIVLDQGY